MLQPRLGTLRTLKAAEVWGSEPQVFTPWLAANLTLLSDALQLGELELISTEVPVGDFRLDILAEDGSGAPVIIENQFGPTDHRHLGQLISYAAGQGPRCTVIWIAERFKEDHRAAIDWLNANTGEDLSFFAVEIEALAIGDSDPAPYFNLVAKPNAWTKGAGAASREAASADGAARHRLRAEYWSSFSEFLSRQHSRFKMPPTNRRSWQLFPVGRAGVSISATINVRPPRVGVELYIAHDAAKRAIDALRSEQGAIDASLGATADYQNLSPKTASRIVVYRYDLDPSNPADHGSIQVWMLDMIERFHRTFVGRVGELELSRHPVSDADVAP